MSTCFGWEVRSTLPLEYLREGAGEPLEVTAPGPEGPAAADELLLEWHATEERPLEAKLYAGEGSYRLWIADGGWFSADPAGPRIDAPADGGLRTEERLWGLPALLCFLARGDLPLHAAAVETEKGAVLLAAPRTYGKSTMAAGFHRSGRRVLTEDTACVRLGPEPAIVPGPAMLRLRHDVAAALELPRVRRLGEDPDRVRFALEEPGDSTPVPLRAIVLLDAGEGGSEIEPVERADALRDLWALSFRLPVEEDVARSFAGVTDVAATVPVLRLRRRLALDSLDEHVETILAHV